MSSISQTRAGDTGTLTVIGLGLALTVAAALAPFIDRVTAQVQAGHLRAGYPGYTVERIDTAVTTYLVLSAVVGVLGVVGWVWTLWVVRSARPWAHWSALAVFVLGTGTALTALFIRDTSGDTGLAPVLGLIGLLPCLAGLAVVILLLRRR